MTDGIAPHDPSYCTNDRIPVHQRPPDPTSPAKHGNLLDVPSNTIMKIVTSESHGDIQVVLANGEQRSSDSGKDIVFYTFTMSLFGVASLPSMRWMIPLCCSNGTVGRFMLRTVDKSPRSTSHDAGSPHSIVNSTQAAVDIPAVQELILNGSPSNGAGCHNLIVSSTQAAVVIPAVQELISCPTPAVGHMGLLCRQSSPLVRELKIEDKHLHGTKEKLRERRVSALAGSYRERGDDIRPMLCFMRWEPVYYHVDGPDFPTNTHEPHGCFVGIAENNGIRMTIALLCRPNRCSMLAPHAPNLRPNPIDGEIIRCHVKFRGDLTLNATPPGIGAILYRSSESEKSQSSKPSEWKQLVPPTFDLPDHNSCSFLTIQEIGECHCLRIVPLAHQADNHLEYTMFHCQPTKGNNDGIIASNEILENVDSLGNSEQLRSFQRNASHRVRENGLLLLPGWKHIVTITWCVKKCHWMVNQALLRAHRNATRFKHGPEVPREHENTMYLDCWSSDAKWHSAVKLEVVMNDDYLVIVDSIPTRVSRRTVRASLVFDAFAKKKANGETLLRGSVIVAAHVCTLLRRLGVFIHAHHHVIEDDHVDVTSLVFPKSMHHQLDAIHCYCGVRVVDCVCMSLFFGMDNKSPGDQKVVSSESWGVIDFPHDRSAGTHDSGTRMSRVLTLTARMVYD